MLQGYMRGRHSSFVRTRADWVSIVEAVHSQDDVDDTSWLNSVCEGTKKAIFPNATAVFMYVIEHEPDLSTARLTASSSSSALPHDALGALLPIGRAFEAFHYPTRPVSTVKEIARTLDPDADAVVADFAGKRGLVDAVGIISHPAPAVVTVLAAMSDRPIELDPYERRLLTRLALHVDAGHRARRHPESVKAELTADGRVLSRDDDAPSKAMLEMYAARVKEARSRRHRTDADGLELWSALLAGRVSLAPRSDLASRARYVVLDNPPATHSLRALTPAEAAALALAARGLSTKLIGYALGIGSPAVSTRLASAVSKMGVMSRAELVRIAALLARDPRAELPDAELTTAESDILELLQRGLTNREIATERSRSVRTIANQVASLLKKTKSTSRRALVARPPSARKKTNDHGSRMASGGE